MKYLRLTPTQKKDIYLVFVGMTSRKDVGSIFGFIRMAEVTPFVFVDTSLESIESCDGEIKYYLDSGFKTDKKAVFPEVVKLMCGDVCHYEQGISVIEMSALPVVMEYRAMVAVAFLDKMTIKNLSAVREAQDMVRDCKWAYEQDSNRFEYSLTYCRWCGRYDGRISLQEILAIQNLFPNDMNGSQINLEDRVGLVIASSEKTDGELTACLSSAIK